MAALNESVAETTTPYWCCLDDDICLIENFVELAFDLLKAQAHNPKVFACGFLLQDSNKKILGVPQNIESGECLSTFEAEKKNGDSIGDIFLFYRTDIMKKFPIPMIEGEKFSPEGHMFINLAISGYKIQYFQIFVGTTDYTSDGYTQNFDKHFRANPKSFGAYYLKRARYHPVFLIKLKSFIRYLQSLYYLALKN